MTIRSLTLSIALFSTVFFSADSLVAGSKWPSVSGSVRATATVVSPIGITVEGIVNDLPENNLWMVRYPSADGTLMTVQLNGDVVQTIRMDETGSNNAHDTFSIIDPYDRVIQTAADLQNSQSTIVITLISTSQ